MTATPLRILVVEDNDDSRMLLEEMLRLLGHAPVAVGSAEAALQVFEQGGFDVLLADISLPGMSGIALAEQLTRRHPGLRVIFASGFGYLVADKTDFSFILLPKPYGVDQLQHALESS